MGAAAAGVTSQPPAKLLAIVRLAHLQPTHRGSFTTHQKWATPLQMC